MNERKNNAIIVPPAEKIGTAMMPIPDSKKDLMLPPKPMSSEDMLKVSGGTDVNPSPGADIPKPSPMKTEEEAEEFIIPKHHKHKKHHLP